ncbi:trehalose-6-phosphate synthase [Nocardia suismassiliense]|uniref:alpha,alpha-trehalose-phosphate synthase (ADP-forming) n=1 Tax=Nocardia suismassiliense TaxID=2077092 RepID=A0ABW6R289_9NOCA
MATGEGPKPVEPEVSSSGERSRGVARKILVTDLDGTLLGGTPTDRLRLRNALTRHPEVTVVFATGRGLESIRAVLRDPLVPQPRWIIADVGASIIDGADLAPVTALQTPLRAGWPGGDRIRVALRHFPALIYQHGVPQDGRCSFHLPPAGLTPELIDAVHALGCSWQYSADTYFDVLPAHASKGNALVALATQQGWSMGAVLVAGDSANDRSMFGRGAHGVIVGNAERSLLSAVPAADAAHRPDMPGAAGILAALQDLGWIEPDFPLVVGYHRAPITWTPDGWRSPSSPNGILPTLHSVFTGNLRAVWAAGVVIETHQSAAHLDDHDTGLPLAFLPLTSAEWSGYFHRACKEALWPVLMSQPHRARFDPAAWAEYRAVNRRFADHIGVHAAPGATVWLHDYNLWLVPGRLRETRPDLRVGLFHHTPFPEPDVFAALPPAAEIRASLGALDWAGFHTEVFADRFLGALSDHARRPLIGVHPLGIDRAAIEQLARSRPLGRRKHDGPVVLSVERLDYIKAPVQKVDAIAELLVRHPELRGALRFRLVCPPPEPGLTAYDATRQLLERRIDEVNQAWTIGGWQPIEYFPEFLSFPEVVDHYLAADVFWVTSLQDGMNLTAKEFIAAQAAVGGCGVLVLSRHTGAAAQLAAGALLTEPNSPTDLVDILRRALNLAPAQRRERLACLSELLGQHNPAEWAAEIIAAIQLARRAESTGRAA